MRRYLFLVVLCLFILLEGVVTTAPLVLALLISYTVSTRRDDVFLLAFISGLLIDLLQAQSLGATSVFLLCSVFLVLLYQRKYEIASYPFILFATLFLSLIYVLIFLHTAFTSQVIFTVIIAEVCFWFTNRYLQIENRKQYFLL